MRIVYRGLVVLAALAALPRAGTAQDLEDLAGRCMTAGAPETRCLELAVAARALQGHAALLGGLGSETSGSASTLGRRLGATPRVAVDVRAAFASVGVPDLGDQSGEASREAGFVLPSVHAGLTVGLFDGFSVLPTVGGILSLDVLGRAGVVFFPGGEGFDSGSRVFSLGVRVGILRESFTLPGVALSLTRRSMGALRYGDAEGAGGGSVDVDPSVTSVRLTVGKDALSVGLLGGVGWDRTSGRATLRAPAGASIVEEADASFTHGRPLIFGGAALNFLILQLSGEVGWAAGFDPVTGYTGTPFDPAGGTFFASVAARLTI